MNWKHVSRKAVKWSAVAVGVVILCAVSLFGALQTAAGRRTLIHMAGRVLAEEGWRAEIGTLTGVVPFHFQLETLRVSDAHGPLLDIGRLELDWSPLSLLRGDIHVRTLRCGWLHLERVAQRRQETNGSSRIPLWFSFLERLRIERLAADEIVAGESVLGERATFRLDADLRAALSKGEWITRLLLERTDGPETRIHVTGTARENGGFLALAVEAREAEKGLLARKAGIDGPIALAIRGEGPAADWKGTMEVKAGSAWNLSGRIRAAYDGGLTLGMEGVAEAEAGFLGGVLQEAHAERVRFALAGALSEDGRIHIEGFSLESGEAGLRLSGSSNLLDGTLKAQVRAHHNELGNLEKGLGLPLSGRFSMEGTISGTMLRPSALFRVEGQELAADRTRVSGLSGEIHLDVADMPAGTGPGFRFKGEGRVEGLSVSDAGPLPERDLQWAFSGEGLPSGPVRVQALSLKGEKNTLLLSGEIDPSTWEGKVKGEAEARDLGVLSKTVGFDLAGVGRAKAAAEGNFKTLSVTGGVEGEISPEVSRRRAGVALWRGAEAEGQRSEVGGRKAESGKGKAEGRNADPSAFMDPLLREGAGFKAKLSLHQGRKLTVSDASLSSSAAALWGGGTFDLHEGRMTGSAHMQIQDLSRWSSAARSALGGSLQADALIRGSPDRLTVRSEISGRDVQAGKFSLGRIRFTLDGSGNVRANDGSFRFEAGEEPGRVSGEGRFSVKGERLSLTRVLLSGPGETRARGTLELGLDSNLVEGTLSGECPDLSHLSTFVNQPLQGRIEFSAETGKIRSVQQLKMAFSGTGIRAGSLQAEKVRIQAALTELSGNPRGSADGEYRNVVLPGIHVSSLVMEARGDGSQVSFDAKTKGTLDRKFDMETRGAYRSAGSVHTFSFTRFQGKFGDMVFRAPETFTVERSAAEISLNSIQLLLGKGRFWGGGRLGSGEVDVSFHFEDVPLDQVRPAGSPAFFRGSGSGELAVKGRLEGPEGMARVRVIGLRGNSPQLEGIPPATLEARADLLGRRLKGELFIHGVTSQPLKTAVDLPLWLSLDPFGVSFPREEEIDGKLEMKADLARLGGLLGLDDQVMAGTAEVGLRLDGTPEHPLVTGTIGVENGTYENARSGTLLKDVTLLVNAGTKGLVIERARASDGSEGTALAEGRLEVDPERGFPFQVDLTFHKLKIVQHDWVTARGEGQVRLKGSLARAVLSGEIQVEHGEFRIPERLSPDVPDLDVIEINGPGADMNPRPEKAKNGDPYLHFDLRLNSPGRFFVRGRGLDSEWTGGVHLSGPAEKPSLVGELSVERGRFSFLDRRFALTQGKITFNGLAHPSPFLDVTASYSAKEILARLQLLGPVRAPEIKLSSEPPLPPDEVLSRVLFGQSMNRISPLQAIQLAQTLNAMAGGRTLDLMSATRKWLRVDQLEVKQSGENNDETSVAAGKYLRDDVYFEVERSIGPGGTKASFQWEFSPNLSLESEFGADKESGIGINWRWDY
jgi:translocation and assembly module TamB